MKALRIALTADPYIPVPPKFYGGIERIVHLLAEHLVARGHQVTLIAHPDSDICGASLVAYGVPPHNGGYRRARELAQVGGYLWRHRRDFDLVHSFGRLAALTPILPWRNVPKIQSYQRPVPWQSVRRAVRLGGGSLQFTACSASMFADRAEEHAVGRWRAIFNAVDVTRYNFVATVPSDAPLVYLGKIERMKGVHVAIAIARGSGRRLIIAGNTVESGPDHEYFTKEILPAIDGSAIQYIGPVDDAQTSRLLGRAAALVFPTAYPEAFGIVMAEAMACGTPVIGSKRGALPEVLREGSNGFLCETVEQGVAAVGQLETIDRAAVRRDCETRFDAAVIASQYEALYAEVAAR
jgi:glycosyltransferase involved in cell wall biosynthesis